MGKVKEYEAKEEREKSDITKEELYFLYKYHRNYDNEPVEKKRQIRYYYENNLRYRGSFYKDRKTFKEHGNPKKWKERKIKRFKTLGSDEDKKYFYGSKQYFETFTYKSNKIIDVSLIKKCNIILAFRENNELIINENALDDIREIVREMSRNLYTVDSNKKKIRGKKYDDIDTYDLGQMQVIYKIDTGYYRRWISTKFFSQSKIVKEASRKIENYVRQVVFGDNIKDGGVNEMQENKYEEFEGEIAIKDLILEEIVVRKRTDNYLSLSSKEVTGYKVESRKMRSLEVV